MTGLLRGWRGLSLTRVSAGGRRMIDGSKMEVDARTRSAFVSPGRVGVIVIRSSSSVTELLDDGPERDGREERETRDDHDHAEEEAREQRGVRRERAGRRRDLLLPGDRARD